MEQSTGQVVPCQFGLLLFHKTEYSNYSCIVTIQLTNKVVGDEQNIEHNM